jgi:hypothetical protein
MQMLTEEQLDWCEQNLPEGKWKVNPQGKVDVKGDVEIIMMSFYEFPVPFGRVKGTFNCKYCKNLKTLKGAPEYVEGFFILDGCINLKSLVGSPKRVSDSFRCSRCSSLENLEGASENVGRFICNRCENLKSLEGISTYVKMFVDCTDCPNLPHSQVEVIESFNHGEITWEEAHKVIHRPNLLRGKELDLF